MGSLRLRVSTLRTDTLRGPDIILKSGSDTGAGAEGTPLLTATLTGADTGSGVDAHAIFITASDTGSGNDGAPTEDNSTSGSETGAGAESTPAIAFAVPNDTSSSQEVAAVAIAFFSDDTGTGTDAIASHTVTVPGTDTGSGADGQILHEFLTVADTATASDDLLTFSRVLLDTAQGLEGNIGDRTLGALDAGTGSTTHSILKHGSAGNIYVGGLRARLIRDSLFQMIKDGLTNLEWFDLGRQHTPITWRESEVPPTEEIPLNTLALSDADTNTNDWELGSSMAEHNWDFFIDFYAEDSAVGIHMIRDVKDLLEGRFSSIGRVAPVFTVYDYSQANKPALFTCDIEHVDVDKAHIFSKPWQKHWYSIALTVVDYYGNEDDT